MVVQHSFAACPRKDEEVQVSEKEYSLEKVLRCNNPQGQSHETFNWQGQSNQKKIDGHVLLVVPQA